MPPLFEDKEAFLEQGPILRISGPRRVERGPEFVCCDAHASVYIVWQADGTPEVWGSPHPEFLRVIRADGLMSAIFPIEMVGFYHLGLGNDGEVRLFSTDVTEKRARVNQYAIRSDVWQDTELRLEKELTCIVPLCCGLNWAEHFQFRKVATMGLPPGNPMIIGYYQEVHWTPWGILGGHIRESLGRYFTAELRAGKVERLVPLTNRGLYAVYGDVPRLVSDAKGRIASVCIKATRNKEAYIILLWHKGEWRAIEFDPGTVVLPSHFEPIRPRLVLGDTDLFIFDGRHGERKLCFEGSITWPEANERASIQWKTVTEVVKAGSVCDVRRIGDAVSVVFEDEKGPGFLARTSRGWTAPRAFARGLGLNTATLRGSASPDGKHHLVWRADDGHLYYTYLYVTARQP